MSRAYIKDIRVLAIDPSTRGFGFAVLEGLDQLIDWGVKETKKNKNAKSLELIEDLIDRYLPRVIVVEDYAGKGSRRCRRIQLLINDISKLAAKRKIKLRSFSRAKIKQTFSESDVSNKHKIAVAIANRFPELAPRLPRFRKPWMSEDYRMSIFDAVAFAVTFSCLKSEEEPVMRPNLTARIPARMSCSSYAESKILSVSALKGCDTTPKIMSFRYM
jgi:RNase H-fold protein (predicted Holliday junction resolvase)